MKTFNKVAVLMGGSSSEREISMMSGHAISKGLREAGYDVTDVVVAEDTSFAVPEGTEAAYIALHGTFGEDGGVQARLREMGLPYTGSGAESSRIAFDKAATREVLQKAGIPVAEGYVITAEQNKAALPLPCVVKPAREGSSVGVTIVKRAEEFERAVAEAAKFDDVIVVEKFIAGREWTVPIVGETVLPIVEIAPKLDGGWYSWDAKYFSGGTTVYTFPEDNAADSATCARVKDIALATFRALGAEGLARVDFRISETGEPFVLELNSLPGCTETSILPKSAAKYGIAFPALCAMILESASCK